EGKAIWARGPDGRVVSTRHAPPVAVFRPGAEAATVRRGAPADDRDPRGRRGHLPQAGGVPRTPWAAGLPRGGRVVRRRRSELALLVREHLRRARPGRGLPAPGPAHVEGASEGGAWGAGGVTPLRPAGGAAQGERGLSADRSS